MCTFLIYPDVSLAIKSIFSSQTLLYLIHMLQVLVNYHGNSMCSDVLTGLKRNVSELFW